MTKILLFEDDEMLGFYTKDNLQNIGDYDVMLRDTGKDSLKVIRDFRPDICIVDIGLPVKDGFEIIAEMRKNKIDTPAIILTALTSAEDAVKGFKIGANDYVRKPFDVFELKARIDSLLQSRNNESIKNDYIPNILIVNKILFDFVSGTVTFRRKEIHLTPYESEILQVLLKHRGKFVGISTIMQETGREDIMIYRNSFYVTLSSLRQKLEVLKNIEIYTQRNVGVKMEVV